MDINKAYYNSYGTTAKLERLMCAPTLESGKTIAPSFKLQEKPARGTFYNRVKKSGEGKLDSKTERANLRRVDSYSFPSDQDTLKLSFALNVLSGVYAVLWS